MRAPCRNRQDQKNRIAPKAKRCRISNRYEARLYRLEEVPNARRQLEPADPQWPKPFGAKRDIGEDYKCQEVDDQQPYFDVGILGSQAEKSEGRDDASCRNQALIILSAQPGVAAGSEQQGEEEEGSHGKRPDND